MVLFRWLKRQKQSRGHGVHSPFAFDLITKVIHSPHPYYAFYDIPAMLHGQGLNPNLITPFNHLSFRLLRYFNSKNVLELNSGKGINTLFLMAAVPTIDCTCVEEDSALVSMARMLLENSPPISRSNNGTNQTLFPQFISSVAMHEEGSHHKGPFDAIFLNEGKVGLPTIEKLLEWSHEESFWVLHSIRKGAGKQLWKKIVNDERINVTFQTREAGVVFPWPLLTPSSYLV